MKPTAHAGPGQAIAMDMYDILAKPWQRGQRAGGGMGAASSGQPAALAAVEDIAAWAASSQATRATMWRVRLRQRTRSISGIVDDRPLGRGRGKLAGLLVDTVAAMTKTYGKFPSPGGEPMVDGAGILPMTGPTGRPNFTETMRDVESREDPGSGRYVARSEAWRRGYLLRPTASAPHLRGVGADRNPRTRGRRRNCIQAGVQAHLVRQGHLMDNVASRRC